MTTGHAGRAALYAVETAHVTTPTRLAQLLAPGTSVAEVPSGVGHHVRTYLRHGATVRLLDAEPAMLAASRVDSAVATSVFRLGTDTLDHTVDVVVCPNAALNYLVPLVGLRRTVTALAELLTQGGTLLVAVLLRHDDGSVDRCGCYDPRAPENVWLYEWTRPDGAGGFLTRRRRQSRAGDELRIDFHRQHNGVDLGHSTVRLSLFDHATLRSALVEAGLRHTATHRGGSDLSEDTAVKEPTTS